MEKILIKWKRLLEENKKEMYRVLDIQQKYFKLKDEFGFNECKEHLTRLTIKKELIKNFIKDLKENKEVKRILKLKNLTRIQIRIYQGAKRFGYFDYPRKITLSRLAKRLSLAPSTVSVHLQKIYSKLIMGRMF